MTTPRNFDIGSAEAWDATLDPERVFFEFSEAAQAELKSFLDSQPVFAGMSGIKPIEAIEVEAEAIPQVAVEMRRLREERIMGGARMAVARPVESLTFEQQMAVPWVMGALLGELLVQNEDGDRAYIITDRGGRMEEGARYSQTRQGGSFHTDGVNLKSGYDCFLLSCIAPAREGGESILINGFTILKKLQERAPEALDALNRELVWEYKGIKQDFYREPIVKVEEGKLIWRYLRNYIEEAAQKTGEALTDETIDAMNQLDEVMDDRDIQFRYFLKPGETAVINDRQIFHGRTEFLDAEDAVSLEDYLVGDRSRPLKRTCSRFWIND